MSYNFYEIQKKMKEISTKIQMCNEIFKISSNTIDEIKTKFNCCKGLAEDYNKHLKTLNTVVNSYNDVLTRVRQGKWLSQNVEISRSISKLIGQSKGLLETLFKFDKKVTDDLIVIISSKGKDRENMINLLNLPPPPNNVLKGGRSKTRKNKKTKN